MCMLLHSGPSEQACPCQLSPEVPAWRRCVHARLCLHLLTPVALRLILRSLPFLSPPLLLCASALMRLWIGEAHRLQQMARATLPQCLHTHVHPHQHTSACLFMNEPEERKRQRKNTGSNTETWRKPLMEAAGRRWRECAKRAGDNKQTAEKGARAKLNCRLREPLSSLCIYLMWNHASLLSLVSASTAASCLHWAVQGVRRAPHFASTADRIWAEQTGLDGGRLAKQVCGFISVQCCVCAVHGRGQHEHPPLQAVACSSAGLAWRGAYEDTVLEICPSLHLNALIHSALLWDLCTPLTPLGSERPCLSLSGCSGASLDGRCWFFQGQTLSACAGSVKVFVVSNIK